MKIATMATGGIGGYLAVKLSNVGFKVATIARGAHLAAIKENGLILDGHGNPTNDPEVFYSTVGSILPFGGHKGFGLAFMIDILSGTLTGGNSSHPDNSNSHAVINNTFAILIDTTKTVSESYFQNDVKRLINWVKASPKAKGVEEILLPGEIEKNNKKQRLSDGIPLDDQTIKGLIDTANFVGMKDVDESFIKELLA